MAMFRRVQVAPAQQEMEKGGKSTRPHRDEKVLYNSAKAKRTCLGRWHYCMSCPGWNKITQHRVVYSRWVKEQCCGTTCPWGRQLDHYDAEIVVDASAHQTLCQVCRGEGDLTLYRLAGGDPSDPSPTHLLSDVPSLFDVFNDVTFELSKINLKGHAGKCLGRSMGAAVWNAPAGYDGPAQKTTDMSQEIVYYDSRTAKRTWLGWCSNIDCCFPNVYKITSERVMYAEWEIWYLCDNLFTALFIPCYCCRGIAIDLFPCCTFIRKSIPEDAEANESEYVLRAKRKAEESVLDKCCCCPMGRTVLYWDIDLLVDIGARQRCSQVFTNEGNLHLHRMAGGDADNPNPLFEVKSVPEVFSLFDDFSYELSQMDLSHFRHSALGQKMQSE